MKDLTLIVPPLLLSLPQPGNIQDPDLRLRLLQDDGHVDTGGSDRDICDCIKCRDRSLALTEVKPTHKGI